MLDERAEARLAAPAVDLLAQRRAVQRQGDLRRERAQGGLDGRVGHSRGRRDEQHGSGAAARRDGRARAPRSRLPRQPELPRASPRRAAGARRPRRPRAAPARRRRRRPARCCRRRRARARTEPRPLRSPRARWRRRASAPAELSVRSRSERALLLAHEAGHAQDDEAEQRGRRAASRRPCRSRRGWRSWTNSSDGRDQRGERQQHQAEAREHRLARRGGLLHPRHRRVQRGGAPQQVEAEPAEVEPQLVVVGAVQGAGRRRRSP